MNGDPYANISEHAFGNALDMAAFTLADGREVTVKDGWHGAPEEQGFLHARARPARCSPRLRRMTTRPAIVLAFHRTRKLRVHRLPEVPRR
jgi:hypothetical protein